MLSPSDNWAFTRMEEHFKLSKGLEEKLNEILRRITIMATTQAEFDAILATLQSDLTAGLNTIAQTLSDLIAKANNGTDFTAEATTAQTMITNLQTAVAAAKADDPGAPPAPPVTTPPATTPTIPAV